MNPSAGGPVRLAAAPAPSAPPGYGESGAWRGFWSQVGPPGTGPGDYSDDDLPGSTGLTEPMPMISPGLPTAPTAVPSARPQPAQPPTPRPAPAPRPVTPASAPPWAPPSEAGPSEAGPYAAPPSAAPPSAPAPPSATPQPAAPQSAAPQPAPPQPAPARTAGSRRAPTRHGRDRGNRTRWGAAYPIVLAGTAAGLAYLWRGPENVRGGVLTVAVTLLLAAAARLVLPERRAGLLVSRRRFADVAAFSILGLALLVAGLVLPAQG